MSSTPFTAAPEGRVRPGGDRAYVAISVALFVATVQETIRLTASMSGGMRMPGGWTMSMAWMVMPGQTWAAAAISFMVM